jgi:hypothetical protein
MVCRVVAYHTHVHVQLYQLSAAAEGFVSAGISIVLCLCACLAPLQHIMSCFVTLSFVAWNSF